jgi:toxin ParE1/3/4
LSRVRFTPEARNDLHEIWDYIARDSVDAASHFTNTIEEKCRLLSASPEVGRGRPELAADLRSFPVGNYVIFYKPVRGGIEIVRVLSAARDIASLF